MLPKRFPPRGEPERVPIASVVSELKALPPGEELREEDGSDAFRTVAGRVMGRRDLGSNVFLDLVDRSGRIQLAFLVRETARQVSVDLGDIIGVRGAPVR